ncbi:MAG: CHAD domain-containing protein [Bacteriovoracaceae bacterium]
MKTLDLRDHLSALVNDGRELREVLIQHMSIKDVHKLRVCVRRLRTDLALLKSPLSDHDKKHLKKIWKKLGRVRDLDIAKDLSEKFSIKPKEVLKERHEARKKLEHILKDKDTEKLFDDIEKFSFRMDTAHVDPVPHINDLRRDLIQTPRTEDDLHGLRIVLKKIRYLAEALGLGVEAFKEFQDVLGEFQDLEIFHKRYPGSLEVRRERKNSRDRALSFARPALSLGFRALLDMETSRGKKLTA